MTRDPSVWQVALPAPLYSRFDYLAPRDAGVPLIGARVRVPFGRSTRIGVITGSAATSTIAVSRLKRIETILDDTPLLPADLLRLLDWAAVYYHHPPGEVILGALPGLLRKGERAEARTERRWRLTVAGNAVDARELARAPRQQALHAALTACLEGLDAEALRRLPGARSALRAFCDKGWVEATEATVTSAEAPARVCNQAPPLNDAQRQALEAINGGNDGFKVSLLDGVTGSGKTEVYFGLIDALLNRQRQVLVLVPEIGLTPQLVARVRERFPCRLALLHSGLSGRERLDNWLQATQGHAPIVIGTRSAVLTPLPQLGAIILDEEHDASYKQQDGFRYHARDVAIMRARDCDIPVILGSATPSLESLYNCTRGRYHHLTLPDRAGSASAPSIRLIDMRHQAVEHGLSETLARKISEHLARDQQVLLFLNRRGYAPTLLCHECGWVADCQRCDAHMILHRGRRMLRCHHCDAQAPVNSHCPGCGNPDLRPLGQGTERLEETLSARFPEAEILRIDRDSTRRKGAMNALIEQMQQGRRQILLGTQMLAKGHHFPNVTLAGILDCDFGLFGADFRAGERMGQLIVQVAGRAGRAVEPGEVLIQTHYPEHPLLASLLGGDYRRFTDYLLEERRAAGMPPCRHMALLRAESVSRDAPGRFLEQVRTRAEATATETDAGDIELLGPAPAPMERRAGRYRAQLMLLAGQRGALHRLLQALAPGLDALASADRVRWSLDVDPIDES